MIDVDDVLGSPDARWRGAVTMDAVFCAADGATHNRPRRERDVNRDIAAYRTAVQSELPRARPL